MPLHTLLHRSSLSRPVVSEAQARQVVQTYYGLHGALVPLGSQQDVNFRLDSDQGSFVLKVCHDSYTESELQAQHEALAFLRQQGVPVPAVRAALSGEGLLALEVEGQPLRTRLLDYIEGQPLTRLRHLSPRLVAELGGFAAASIEPCPVSSIQAWSVRCSGTRVTANC